ncbi:MAG: hypothetical protein KY462_06760 [Actinobacteria bacterium]|nr:hypothetical protein [Actinomycetota bacterium]
MWTLPDQLLAAASEAVHDATPKPAARTRAQLLLADPVLVVADRRGPGHVDLSLDDPGYSSNQKAYPSGGVRPLR